MSELDKDNRLLLRDLLRRAFPSDMSDLAVDRMVAAFGEQRNTSPELFLYDTRTNKFLTAMMATASALLNPQTIINRLVDLHDA